MQLHVRGYILRCSNFLLCISCAAGRCLGSMPRAIGLPGRGELSACLPGQANQPHAGCQAICIGACVRTHGTVCSASPAVLPRCCVCRAVHTAHFIRSSSATSLPQKIEVTELCSFQFTSPDPVGQLIYPCSDLIRTPSTRMQLPEVHHTKSDRVHVTGILGWGLTEVLAVPVPIGNPCRRRPWRCRLGAWLALNTAAAKEAT